MGIPLNSILNLTEEQIKNSKIELNMLYGKNGQPFIDRWLELPEEERSVGAPGVTSYWGWYGKQRNFHEGQWVFSFVRLYHGNEWLFVSAAKVLGVPKDRQAEVEILKTYEPLFGRMVIHLVKGQTCGGYCFSLEKHLSVATVREILPVIYSGETFQGYGHVSLPFSKLDRIFKREIFPSYHDALERVTGVYCLTDRKTGKLYIGFATGAGGIAQRWVNYLDSAHGGNKKLRELYNREDKEHFEQNFVFTFLEYFGLSYEPEKILDRER